jgi:hypothetical protein
MLVVSLLPAATSAALGPEVHFDGTYGSQGRYHGTKSGQYQTAKAQKHWFEAQPSKHRWQYSHRYSKRNNDGRIIPSVISRERLNLDQTVSTTFSGIPTQKLRWISPRTRSSNGTDKTSISKSAAPRSHQRTETRLMLEIGALLGLAYLAFLVLWFWTTRHARV